MSATPGLTYVQQSSSEPKIEIKKGCIYLIYSYSVGFSISLDQAEAKVDALKERSRMQHKRSAPKYFEFSPVPLRITQPINEIKVGNFQTESTVNFVIYDFGAISVTYKLPIWGSFTDLIGLSDLLYEADVFYSHSRELCEKLVKSLSNAVNKPQVSDLEENYTIFEISETTVPIKPDQLEEFFSKEIAQILRAEPAKLSKQEAQDASKTRISYGPDDITYIDWNAAILFDPDADDVRSVLDYANAQLLELRTLDDKLDRALDASYEALADLRNKKMMLPFNYGFELRKIAAFQVDSALLYEGVNNAIKLFGDQYLARVYSLASGRFHLEKWDGSIRRKLQTLESVYEKISDRQFHVRFELLEWIIVILIFISIILPYLG